MHVNRFVEILSSNSRVHSRSPTHTHTPDKAREAGRVPRVVCEGYADGSGAVKLVELDKDDRLANLKGTTSALVIETDLMGSITVVETDPLLPQTGYALYSDLLRLLRARVL